MKIEPMTPEELTSFREHTIETFAAEKVRSKGANRVCGSTTS